ncbi:MAG: ABC transporter ATP-binding protein [Acidobacteria bacterium]|nr:ABC transporter ATP-binding protein [Acidobacteriota bacterium]
MSGRVLLPMRRAAQNCIRIELMKDFQKLIPYLKPYFMTLLGALLLLALAGGMEILLTSLVAPLFDDVLTPHLPNHPIAAHGKFLFVYKGLGLTPDNLLARIAGALLLITFCKCLCLYLSNFWMSYVGQSVTMRLRNAVYQHIMRQSVAFFSATPTGRLMSNVISDIDRLQEAVSVTLAEFVREVVLLLALIAYVLYVDWRLTLLSLTIAPLALLTTITLGRRIRRASGQSQEHIAALAGVLQETITGQRIVKAFGMEDVEVRKFLAVTGRLFASNLRAARIMFVSSPLMEFLGVVCFVPLLLYAHQHIATVKGAQLLTLGAFSAFLFALFRMYDPIRKLSRIHVQFQQAFAAAARVFATLETHREVLEQPGAVPLPPIRREIAFENLSFIYDRHTDTAAVLKDINLKVTAGQVVALAGSSGAGKTTFVNLLPRFYDITEGSLSIDGLDIRKVTLSSLRAQISLVTQETFLFNDTARNNILYGRPYALENEVIEAAQAAKAHDFVMQLPQGYDTLIGERGQRLSGGERQRLSIARAILKNSPILILDEATSALDSESEKLVQAALANLMRGRTTFVIAHRLSTIRQADVIVVLEDGEIKEVGSHRFLMAREGIYRKLYDLQFSEQELEAGDRG